eukprot:366547-Chlamydomonas_euryale.AAC.9
MGRKIRFSYLPSFPAADGQDDAGRGHAGRALCQAGLAAGSPVCADCAGRDVPRPDAVQGLAGGAERVRVHGAEHFAAQHYGRAAAHVDGEAAHASGEERKGVGRAGLEWVPVRPVDQSCQARGDCFCGAWKAREGAAQWMFFRSVPV